MEPNNEIDDLFKEIIEPYEMNHSDKVWESLNSQLENKSSGRDRAVIFRLRISLGILLFLFGLFATYHFLSISEPKNKSLISVIDSPTRNKNYTGDGNNTIINNNNAEGEHFSQISSDNKVGSSEKNFTKKQHQTNTAFANVKLYKNISNSSGLNNKQPSTYVFEKNEDSIYKSSINEKEANIAKNEENETSKIESINQKQIKESNPMTNVSDTNLITSNIFDTALVADVNNSVNTVSNEKIADIKTDQYKKRFSLIAYFSPDFTKKYTKVNRNNDNNNNNNKQEEEGDYNNNEVSAFSYNTGVLVGYDLTPNWIIKVGGTYANLSQTVKPKTVYATAGTDGAAHYQFATTYGTSELANDKNAPSIGDSIDINSNSAQSIHIIGIPLIVQYGITKNKLNYYAQLGLGINFISGEKLNVETSNEDQTIRDIEGLNKYYLGGMLGLGVSYNPIKRFSILLEPTIRGAITPINNNTPISTRPISFGLGIGLAWHF